MKKTKIEWADSTWNPVTGCLHNCEYCYAAGIAHRFGGADGGQKAKYIGDCIELDEPLTRTTKGGHTDRAQFPYGFFPTFHRYRLDEPSRWTRPCNIFVCSMADLFGAWVPEEWIAAVFAACEAAPRHNYIFLTKNPQRYGELAQKKKLPKRGNFWYGSTITNRQSKRYPGRLTDNTFLSIEPLQEDIDPGLGSFGGDQWIIIGAETGNRKEKITPERAWIEKICDAAAITQAAVFMKDSLIPVMGETGMRRELPAGLQF